MIVRTDEIKDVCNKILFAVDSDELSIVTETLSLKAYGGYLNLAVTNREYYVNVPVKIVEDIEFSATVGATIFLKLISQITTDTIELTTDDTTLYVKGNGSYKLPLIYDGSVLLELPKIDVENVTATADVSGDLLNSILTYNGKELSKSDMITRPVQRLYYIDNEGAITFTKSACVNKFNLPCDVRILLNPKIVKLFKLFKNESVKFSLGHTDIGGSLQTRVSFCSDSLFINAILSASDDMIDTVPVEAIRKRAYGDYSYSANVNKDALSQALSRISLLSLTKSCPKPYSRFTFSSDKVVISDTDMNNFETVYYNNSIQDCSFETTLDLNDIKTTLDSCTEPYINIKFGDEQAVVVVRNNIHNVIPTISVV